MNEKLIQQIPFLLIFQVIGVALWILLRHEGIKSPRWTIYFSILLPIIILILFVVMSIIAIVVFIIKTVLWSLYIIKKAPWEI